MEIFESPRYVFEPRNPPETLTLVLDLSQIVRFAPIYPLLYLVSAFLSSLRHYLLSIPSPSPPKRLGQDDLNIDTNFLCQYPPNTHTLPTAILSLPTTSNLRSHRTWTSTQHLLLIHAGRATFILLLPLSTSNPQTSSLHLSQTLTRRLSISHIQPQRSLMLLSPQMQRPSKNSP